jgi:hypothetical protein
MQMTVGITFIMAQSRGCKMRLFPVVLCLVGSATSVTAHEQKIVTRYALDAQGVPAAVNSTVHTSFWDGIERGPVPDLREYAHSEAGIVWLGNEQGAARHNPHEKHPWDRWQYFRGSRWLQDNNVSCIWVDDDARHETVWIRTETGVNRIEWKPITWTEKAAHYDALVEAHYLRHGFVSQISLKTPGDLSTSHTTDCDNDGLMSAMYLAAQAYRYAGTRDVDARIRARRTLDAIIRLEEINSMPGFYARSFKHVSEPSPDPIMWGKRDADGAEWIWVNQDVTLEKLCQIPNDWYRNDADNWVQGANKDKIKIPHHGEWHATPDRQWLWKGDTSSDETVGHYYAYALYYDLVADDAERKLIQTKVRLLTDTLIANDYCLLDLNGIPTRWGNWNESYFDSREGRYERALRCMELLSLLKVSYHITDDQKYQKEYLRFIKKGYALYTSEYRRWDSEFVEVNFSDDELYYLSVHPLMRYEDDPDIRRIYLDGMRFTWGQVASDKNALWSYINAECGIVEMNPRIRDDAERTLARTPWEMIEWSVENSHRIDFGRIAENDRFGRPQFDRVIPVDERPIHKHNASPYLPDGGSRGSSAEAPTYWLLPYWMGRYHGWIN